MILFYESYNFNENSYSKCSLFASSMNLKVVLSAAILKQNMVFDMWTSNIKIHQIQSLNMHVRRRYAISLVE